jgi:hypothetical protein
MNAVRLLFVIRVLIVDTRDVLNVQAQLAKVLFRPNNEIEVNMKMCKILLILSETVIIVSIVNL